MTYTLYGLQARLQLLWVQADMRASAGGSRTGLTELHGFSNTHLKRAVVVFRCRQVGQPPIPVDEPQSTRHDADAHRRVTRFKTLKHERVTPKGLARARSNSLRRKRYTL